MKKEAHSNLDPKGISRRRFGVMLASIAGSSALGGSALISLGDARAEPLASGSAGTTLFDEAVERVFPRGGLQSGIALEDSILKLVEHGVIDPDKFLALYEPEGEIAADEDIVGVPSRRDVIAPKEFLAAYDKSHPGPPPELRAALNWPSLRPIHLTRQSANHYVNLLWPIGLANFMKSNEDSPVNGDSLPEMASTGGWTVGREDNGAAYFNKFRIVELTPEQEALVTRIAQNTYRPCCNNSTFFQDCNHGSALLGLLQLGASQGFGEEELYGEALAFNSFWFPSHYIQTALYFTVVLGLDWPEIDPATVMGFDYSALGPWQENVEARIAEIPDLIPQMQGGANCGV
jgi:hypothetical protein